MIVRSRLQHRVMRLYLDMLHTSKEIYPNLSKEEKTERIKRAFLKNKQLQTDDEIEKAINRGEYVLKEMEAMHSFGKYRTMKRLYEVDNTTSLLDN
jgi:hypothetical protein